MVKNAIKKIPSFLLSPLFLFIFSQYFLYCSPSLAPLLGFSRQIRPWLFYEYPLLCARALLLAGRRGIFQFTRVHRRCGSSTRFRSLATSLMSVAVLRHGDELPARKILGRSRSSTTVSFPSIRSCDESVNLIARPLFLALFLLVLLLLFVVANCIISKKI